MLRRLQSLARRLNSPQRAYLRRLRSTGSVCFIHINKCGGMSVERALGIPLIHDTALQRIEKIGLDRWNELYTFTIVRHPYAKVSSHYRYRLQTNETGLADGHIGLNDWIREAYGRKNPEYYNKPRMFQPCSYWITDHDGKILVDQVMKLETIDEDWGIFCDRTGFTDALGKENTTSRGGPQIEPMNADSKVILNDHFASDFAMFGYPHVDV